MRQIVWIFLGIVFPLGACAQSDAIVTTASPSNNRTVTIRREYSNVRTQILLTSTDVNTGRVTALSSPIYYEGAFDPLFERYYSSHEWLAENALWLGYNLSSARHHLVLENCTSTVVDYVEIRTEDLYFVFDLLPKQRVVLPLAWTDNKRNGVFLTVVAKNDGDVLVSSERFPFPKGDAESYLVSLGSDGPRISQPNNQLAR